MKLIDAITDTPHIILVFLLSLVIFLLSILICIGAYNGNRVRERFNSDTIIKLEPGYKIINMNETASENTNYVIIHTKNAKNDDVLITYKIENKTKKTELVHKIIVKEDK